MTRFSLTLAFALVAACILCACGGGDDTPDCQRPFIGPTKDGKPLCLDGHGG